MLADVCRALRLQNRHDIIKNLDDDERGVVSNDTPGGPQEIAIINESGLYSVILRSDKPEAKTFKRWVTHEALPSIRRTGSYTSKGANHSLSLEPLPVSTTAQLILRILQDLEHTMPYAFGEVQINDHSLCRLAGIKSTQTFIMARRELIKAGYISVSSSIKGKPAIYQIHAKYRLNRALKDEL